MDNRATRLQALSNRWFNEPLKIYFPDLGEGTPPATLDEFVRNRLPASFSCLSDSPEIAGMTKEQAAEFDKTTNTKKFGVPDPKAIFNELGKEFKQAPQVSPEVIKKSMVILAQIRTDSAQLAKASKDIDVAAAHHADDLAATQAMDAVQMLAQELGISIPISQGVRPGGKA